MYPPATCPALLIAVPYPAMPNEAVCPATHSMTPGSPPLPNTVAWPFKKDTAFTFPCESVIHPTAFPELLIPVANAAPDPNGPKISTV
jgi:hypothetical protein